MGYKLCITEKKSVGEDIARVVGATNTTNKGYIEGNGYIITWAMGHLVGLSEPEEYGYVSQKDMYDREKPEMRQKALSELPIIPQEWKLSVIKSTEYQFNIVKQLMHRADVDIIIDCGDAGPEGHILQWFIRIKANCNKPVERFIATDMTDSAIKYALEHLQPIDKYKKVIQGEYCKKKADWILGMSLSRAASLTYNAPISAGRVMSPTQYFVIERYLAHKNFKSKPFYSLECEFDGFTLRWQRDTADILPPSCKDEAGRLLDKQTATRLVEELNQVMGEITKLETKKKKQERPQLYDTESLAKDCIKIYGYKGKDVAEITEKLYHEYKITTYPRTDSKYITRDLAPEMVSRIKDIATIEQYKDIANKEIAAGLNLDKRIVDDTQVEDHHAIITTSALPTFDLSKLDEKERNILHLIITRMLAAFSQAFKYRETAIEVTFPNGIAFKSSVKVPDDMGFKAVTDTLLGKQDEDENKEEQSVDVVKAKIFSSLSAGQKLKPLTIGVKEGATTAPPLLTEADLIDLMSRAGERVENGAILKGKGIGTQATKLATIEKLFDLKYIEYKAGKSKTPYIIPTTLGMNVIKVLPPKIYSPALTADWENKIELIRQEKLSEKQFMSEFQDFIEGAVNEVRTDRGVDFTNSLCTCPICKKGKIVSTEKSMEKDGKKINYVVYWCTQATEKKCNFSVRSFVPYYRSMFDKNVPKAKMKEVIETGTFVTTKDKKKYTFKLEQVSDGKYKGMWCINPVFPKKKK